MKKKYIILPAMMLLLGICVGCSGDNLPAGFEKEQVVDQSKSFIRLLTEREYAKCYDQFNDIMKNSMDQKKLENTFNSIFEGLGGFVRFKSESLSQSKSLGVDYAVCVIKCLYENGEATFTISLDKDLQIGGLYIK
ncbi:hypothetical protein M2140_001862 [Clostridiales Family XIII bacterium PM5-7]